MAQLGPTRRQLHSAIQFPAIFARAYLPTIDEDLEAALLWNSKQRSWVSQPVRSQGRAHQIALDPALFALIHLQDEGALFSPWPLDGKTIQETFSWLQDQAMLAELPVDKLSLSWPFELPDPVQVFEKIYPDALLEWNKFFDNAYQVLLPLAENIQGASPVRTWPHHFDMAVLITHDQAATHFTSVGLSPGDHHYDQPYFYTAPWPAPHPMSLPALRHGMWHTKGFTAAVLPATQVWAQSDQEILVKSFVTDTVALSQQLVHPT